MRYTYEITKPDGQSDKIEAMSYKKMLNSLQTKLAPGVMVQVKYRNKKGRELVKNETIKAKKEKIALFLPQCQGTGDRAQVTGDPQKPRFYAKVTPSICF